jgi:hypothetical protein
MASEVSWHSPLSIADASFTPESTAPKMTSVAPLARAASPRRRPAHLRVAFKTAVW